MSPKIIANKLSLSKILFKYKKLDYLSTIYLSALSNLLQVSSNK